MRARRVRPIHILLRVGVRRLALTAAALALLLPIALLPALVCAQSRDDQKPPGQQPQTPQISDAMMEGHGPDHVNIRELPSVTMTAVPGYGVAPLVVGFFVSTIDPEGKGFVSYVWNFGDGQVSMDPPLTFFHTYATAGNYIATVNATTSDGRTATAYVPVTVRSSGLY